MCLHSSGCFNLCVQRDTKTNSDLLYNKHTEIFVEYYKEDTDVYLQLKAKLTNSEYFLREMLRCWTNHKVMNKWIQHVFQYLDRFHVRFEGLPTLSESGSHIFKVLVYDKFKQDMTAALLSMVEQERDSTLIMDKVLVKEVVGIYIDIGSKSIETYKADFEVPFIEATAEIGRAHV